MNYKESVIQQLKEYNEKDIVISRHAKIRANQRQISLKAVKENILNPKRLKYAELQDVKQKRYGCLFAYGKLRYHKYVLCLKKKCIVVTIIDRKQRWEWKLKK